MRLRLGHLGLVALLATTLMVAAGASARAAELLMFTQAGCPWCAAFDREVAPVYPKTEEGKLAPLRRVDVDTPLPADLAFIKVERLTPLFVLVDNGHEIGRIRGYPGDDNFWGMLDGLMKKVEAAPAPEQIKALNATALPAIN
ncbi:MAG TPA: transcriptional regulator [Pseudolabrys sp.]|nr:transcriptional regulator [Pseudolabrys sp.]